MAAAVGWSVEEDGSLSVDEQTVGIAYHPRLNTVLAVTAEPSIKVLDVNSGVILKKSSLSAPASRHVECRYLSGSDQLFLTDGHSVGLRKDLGGVLLLDSALQTPVTNPDKDVMVEIPYSEASQLLACLRKNKIANSETVMESIEEELERYKLPNDHAYHKTTKWATVHLRLPHATLKKVVNGLVVELCRTHQRVSALPICTAILDRLQRLYPDGQEPLVVGGDTTIEKSQMYSEATRRQTFAQWPHMDYKWALPEPMAQAGFYHQPSSIGDDRAMCFTCSVCLVCWEPTDEPWSEHERHSPTCPFVRGEPTHNVPFSVTLSTGPAHTHSKNEKISCVSEGNTSSLMATSTDSGCVCIWEVHEQLKLATRFIVNPKDPIFKGQGPVIMDTEPAMAVKQAWVAPEVPVSVTSSSSSSTSSTSSSTSSGSTGHLPMKDEQALVNSPKGLPETSSKTEEMKQDPSVEESEREKGAFGSLEVIEVSGAWKVTDNGKQETNGPATDEGTQTHNAIPEVRDEEPSDSVVVSALGMLNASKLPSLATLGTSDMSFPCLVTGVSIRKEDQEIVNGSKEDTSRNSVIETDNAVDVDGPKDDENGDDAGIGGAPPKKLLFADAYLGDSVDGDVDGKVGSKVAYTNYLVVYCMMYKGKPLPVVKKSGEKASSSSGFHKTQSMYFSLSQETQKLDLEEDELGGYSDLEDPLNFQFSPMVNNNPPPIPSGSGSVVSKQVSMSVKAVQCVELPESVQTNDYVVTSVRTSLDEQHLMVVLSPHSGKMFEREFIDGGIDQKEMEEVAGTSKESTTESVQNDLNKGSSPFVMMSNEECGPGEDEVDTGPCSSAKDDADARTIHPPFLKDLPPRAPSGGFLVIYKLKRAGQMISVEKEPCHIHQISSTEDSLSYLTPLPSGVTDASSDEDEVDPYMDSSTDNMDKDETDSPTSPSIGKWTALTQDGRLIVFDAASFSVLLSILPSHFDFTLTSFGPEDKTNHYVALTYCTGMERLCVCTGGGKISFLQLDDGESSQSIKVHSKADQMDSGKMAILDSRLTANIDKSSKEFIINSNLTISALHTLHQLTKFEILVPRFSATVPPSWTEIQQEQQQRRHPQHLHQRQQGDALQHTRTWKLQPDGSTSQEHLFEIVLPRMCAVGHIDIKFSLLPFCSAPPGIQVTLLQQSEKYRAGDKEKMNIKSTPIDAHINFNMNAGSSTRSKEPKEQNLDLPDLPPPFLGALGTDHADGDEAGPSNGRSSAPPQAGSSTQSSGQRSALTESSFLRRHREDVLCGPCGLELFVDTPSHTGTVMLTSKELMLWKGRSFLLHIWASDEGSAEATNGRSKAARSDQASSFVPQFHTNVDLADRLTTVQLRKDMEKYSGCDWIQELSITVCKSKKVNLPKERIQRALMVESSNFHQDLLNTVTASSTLSSSMTEHKQKQLLAFDVLCWVAGVHISEPERPSGLVEATEHILPEIIRICYLEAERSLAHKCSRFLALCLGCAKRSQNPNVAASFQKALLQSLLQWLPTVACAPSSGSLHWFFVILGLVKHADYEAVSGGCMAMLKAAARQLDEATLPQHIMLRAKFGYYGTPLEPTLFDVEPPRPPSKLDSAGPSTASTGTTTSSSVPLPQIWTEVGPYSSHQGLPPVTLGGGGAFDIGAEPGSKGMSLRGKGALGGIVGVENGDGSLTSGGYFMKGLLEVEPLHFACCGMSDGAHIERIGGGIHTASSVHPMPQGQGGKSNAAQPGNPPTPAYLATLTNAMATAEKQLQKLKEKTKALVQLKKYNYMSGSSKGVAEPSPKNSPLFMTPPISPPSEPAVGQVPQEQPPLMYSIPDDECGLHGQPGEGSQGGKSSSKSSSKDDLKFELDEGVPSSASLVRNLLHPPSSHMMVIERMHSGARRYAVLDFGRPIVLTDVYIPACSDLTSLSVDIWTQLEEVDGQRLAVAMDIESRDLVLNDLLPPPVCRYLKITVVGNYGSNSPKSKVPLGTFYGHSFIHLEAKPRDLSDPSLVELRKEQYVGLAMAILDDIQCRYSLATSRLQKLLQAYESFQTESQMDGSFTQTREKMDTNGSIRKAYVECVQLQQQLNVVQRTILRLRQQKPHQPYTMVPISSPALAVKNTSTDALRIMCEHLLEVLLSTTQGAMALPVSLCCALDAESCKSIFRHLCVMGTPRLSLLTGTLLVRVCGSRQWWGEFLAAALKEFFQSDQPTMFPQDRVFLLLTSLGQTSLASSNASNVLEDLLRLLTELLSPLLGNQFVSSYGSPEGSLDLPLVGWVLLFLSRVLDHSSATHATGHSSADNTQDAEAGATAGAAGGATAMPDHQADRGGAVQGGGGSNRWDFLTSQLQAPGNNSQRSHTSGRDVVRGVKKQVQSHKDLLYDIKGGKEVRNVLRARMAARSARGQKSVQGGSSRGAMDGNSSGSSDLFSTILLTRDKCIPVVQGLVRLLLAMDFTCHVDLFLVTCKVLARIANATRPAITLPEIMSQDQLIQLVSRFCSSEYCAGNSAWGGPWPSHAITCLLLDILEGERLYPYVEEPAGASGGASYSPPMGATGADPDLIADSLASGGAEAGAPADAAEAEVNNASGGEYDSGGNGGEGEENEGLEEPLIIDELSGDPDIVGEGGNDPLVDMDLLFGSWKTSGGLFGENAPKKVALKSGAGSMVDPVKIPTSALLAYAKKNRKDKLKILVRGDGRGESAGSAFTPRMSSAVDARLDQDLEMSAEWFLKMSSLMEAETVSQTFTSLPPPPAFAPEEKPDVELLDMGQTDDDLAASRAMSGSSSNIHPTMRSSRDLLAACFHQLFAGLEAGRIRLHSLLQLWLTINEGSINDTDGNTSHFNDSRVPSFPLDKPSISHMLATLRKEHTLSVWTWCLAFRVLTVQINTRGSTKDAVSVANSMVNDPNMFHSLVKFLSGGSFQGRRSGHQDFQVGPTVTLAFHQLLLRLHLRVFSGPSAGAKALKNLLLKVVQTLVQPREAISAGIGPLDAQITFLELILEQTFSSTDLNSIATMVDNITLLIHEHVIDGSGVTQLGSENGGSARANLANVLAGKLKAGASRVLHNENSREALMCGLLQLVNELLKMSVSQDPFGTSVWSPVGGRGSLHSSGVAYPTPPTSMSDDDKERNGDVSGLSAAASSAFASWAAAPPQSQPAAPLRLADLVLTNKETVSNLLFALGHSSSMAMAAMLNPGFFSQGSEPLLSAEPLSIGDHIFQILATLNKEASHVRIVLQAILSYLSCANGRRGEMLSEPLLWYTLSVLNSPTAMDSMHEIGGIEIICANLVNSSRASIDPNPSIISPIMQLTCPPKAPSSNTSSTSSSTNTGFTKRGSSTVDEENVEGFTNFAPYGVISCSNMTTRPAESLLLPTLSNRRSRQSWAHTFSSEETWCDLTITLPCAVVLEEIHILPHVTNLATCPSAVSVEISPNGSSTIPVCPPLATSGLTSIKLKMPRPMVTSSVCLQLRRPRESTLMALTRIRLLGTTVLGGGQTGGSGGINFSHPLSGLPLIPPTNPHHVAEDEAVRGSTRWLRLLHHCLAGTFLSSTVSSIAQTASQTPGLLTTCMALLASPHCRPNRRDIESLLLQLSRSRTEVGLALVDMFLRNNYCFGHGEHDSGLGLLGRPFSLASDSSVDIIYQLGTGSDAGTRERLQTLLDWLGDTARVALHMHSSYHRTPRTFSPVESGLLHPAPIHVHCVAAVLWATHSQNTMQHMVNMIPTELFSSIYEWSTVLPVNSALKRAADFVLCSMCMIQPAHFDSLLQWMGVMVGGPVELQASITDDSKEDELNISLTDDSKGANLQHQQHQPQPTPHLPSSQPITRQEFSHVIIDEAHLSLLALACQSDVATKRLLDSQFLVLLAEALAEFCTQELIRTESLNGFSDPLTDASKLKASGSRVQSPRSPRSSARRGSTESLPSDATVVLTADLVAPVLNFFKDLSAQIEIKNWLASPEGVVFWAPLLALLCTSNTVTLLSSMPNFNGAPRRSHLLSASQRAALENASIAFFSRCTLCHPSNQKLLAQVICDVICTQDLQTGSPFVISGFMRRLILQLMLEDESLAVAVSSVCQLIKGPQSWTGRIVHPSYGLGHKNMLVETKLTSTCAQLITYLTDTLGLKNLPGDKKPKPSSDASKTDKQSFVMVNLSPDKLDVTETEVNGNIGNSIDAKPKTSSVASAEPQAGSATKLPTSATPSSSQIPIFGGIFSTVPQSTSAAAASAGASTSGGATGGATGGAAGGAAGGASGGATGGAAGGAAASATAGASASTAASSSTSTKQPDKFLLYPGATNFPTSMVPTLPPELLPKSMDRWAPFFNTFSNPATSMAGAGTSSFNMPGLVISHERLGSQNFPGRMTIGQAINILQRRGLPEGSPTLELNIRMSSSLLGASKTDSSKTQEAQEGRNEASTSANSLDSDQHIPEEVLLDTPPISSFLEVFARLGGLALIAEHLPQLYQDAPLATQQQHQAKNGAHATNAGGSSVDKMTASGGGPSAAMHSSWWKYSSDLGLKDLGEFEDYEVLMEGPHSTTITSVGGSTLTTTSNVPSYGLGSTAAHLQATSFSNIGPLHTIPMTAASSSSSSSSSCPPQGSAAGQTMGSCTAAIPPHSLAAFGLFLRLPGYAEVLLKEQKKAQFLLRLMLGVTDDGDGGQILSSPLATSLPTLPFTVLVTLFDSTPLTTDDGVLLRRMTLEIGAIHLVLACLSVLSHHGPRGASQPATAEGGGPSVANGSQVGGVNDKNQNFWAKGTGFGTGSTTSGWNVEEALVRQKAEEEHVTCLLKVLSSYINPINSTSSNERSASIDQTSGDLDQEQLTTIFPAVFVELLTQSCLIPAISSYLRNDSVLDMSRHVPLYCAVLEILRALALCPLLVHLLLPQGDNGDKSVIKLLENIKGCVDTYTSKLKLVKPSKKSSSRHSSTTKESSTISKEEEAEAEGLTQLVPEIQRTVEMVKKLTSKILAQRQGELNDLDGAGASAGGSNSEASKYQSADEKYIAVMTDLQFDTFQMVTEDSKGKIQFAVPHHYASNAKSVGNVTNAARARRLAQEAVTLSTSLPLSASSSVFVRCDEDRLDVMKVLITGPSETPYSNGCFEFDIYFPADYPNSPMLVNLETTGQHSVRFNPNLYNDGKVCLSVLNTWHGRPEEKWNSQTSSFLQVLVSIQSLILVSEPYFNEPGYERSRGTQAGTWSSREYDANIMQATVEWGMLDMVRNPPPVFKDVVQAHFYLKRAEVMGQCEEWIALVGQYCNDKRVGRSMLHHWKNLKKHTAKLREELSKLQPPEFLREQLDPEVEPLPPLSSDVTNDVSCASVSEDADKSSENDAEHSGSSSSSQEITTAETSTADSQVAEPSNMFGMPPGGVVVYDPVWGFD